MIRTQMGMSNRSENGRMCIGRFVRYHPATELVTKYVLKVCDDGVLLE
jgi:hypothetical protein